MVNLKEIIENLLKWLVPILLLYLIVGVLGKLAMQNATDNMFNDQIKYQLVASYSLIAIQIAEYLINIGVGAWLYVQAKNVNSTKLIWCIFGIVKPFVALPMFFAMILYIHISDNFELSTKRKD